MAARSSVATTKALEWTRRRITSSTSIHRTTTADQLSRGSASTAHTARLSIYTAHRQAHKHILPGSIPKQQPSATNSTPIVQPLEQTLDRRLRFLSKTRSTFTKKNRSSASATATAAFFDHSNQPSSNNTPGAEPRQQRQHRKQKRTSWKSYTPGFRQGDFICPQCGTHNFRPPEHTQAVLQQSTVVVLSKKHNRLPPMDQHQHHGASGATATAGTGTGSQRQQQHRQQLTRFQREIIPPQRKYPQGAAGHCFECGFQTSFTIPSSSSLVSQSNLITLLKDQNITSLDQSTATASASTRTQTVDRQHHQHTETPSSLLSAQYKNDIRLTNPRDYVCPQCQTVNYSNRLHCVGCGTLAPWIHTRVVEQTRQSPSPSQQRRSTRRAK